MIPLHYEITILWLSNAVKHNPYIGLLISNYVIYPVFSRSTDQNQIVNMEAGFHAIADQDYIGGLAANLTWGKQDPARNNQNQ